MSRMARLYIRQLSRLTRPVESRENSSDSNGFSPITRLMSRLSRCSLNVVSFWMDASAGGRRLRAAVSLS